MVKLITTINMDSEIDGQIVKFCREHDIKKSVLIRKILKDFCGSIKTNYCDLIKRECE